jgi:hypothetical protein
MNSSDIARGYGVIMDDERSPKEHCNWDGNQFNTQGMKEEGKLHELGHWAISEDRHLPDFGLGPGPDTNSEAYNKAKKRLGIDDEDEVAFQFYDKEETRACVMEFIHGALCGHNMARYMEDRFFTTRGGRWDDSTGSCYSSFMDDIGWLQSKKIINDDWVPLLLEPTLGEEELKRIKDFKEMVERI